VYGVLKVLPILRLHRIDHDYIVLYLSVGISSAVISPVLAYLAAATDPGVVQANRKELQKPCFSATGEECNVCGAERGPGNRSGIHHCRTCDHCVAEFDHHCGIVGVCIGRGNRLYFLALLTVGASGIDALFIGTLASIMMQPPDSPDILGLNMPVLVIIQAAGGLSGFAILVRLLCF
jgi:hypothetical protein